MSFQPFSVITSATIEMIVKNVVNFCHAPIFVIGVYMNYMGASDFAMSAQP